MKHYAVVMLEYGNWVFVYDGKHPFITKDFWKAEQHAFRLKEEYPDEKYQIVSFDVKEST